MAILRERDVINSEQLEEDVRARHDTYQLARATFEYQEQQSDEMMKSALETLTQELMHTGGKTGDIVLNPESIPGSRVYEAVVFRPFDGTIRIIKHHRDNVISRTDTDISERPGIYAEYGLRAFIGLQARIQTARKLSPR